METNNPQCPEVYTDGDYDRLGTMKKAVDVVYAYFRWVVEDHRRLMNDKDHKKRIMELVHDVMAVFGLTDQNEMLARYFIANVLQSCQEVDFKAMGRDSWAPFSQEALAEVYKVEEIVDMLDDLAPHMRCMYAGRFMADSTDSNQWLGTIGTGTIVGCDPSLVMMSSWDILLEAFDIEDDTTFVCVGKAVMCAREEMRKAIENI